MKNKPVKIYFFIIVFSCISVYFLSGNNNLIEAHEGFDEIRINAGGPSFIDPDGKSWSADTYSNTGNTYSTGNSISGTLNDQLYQSERWDPNSNPELSYNIPVVNGNYEVKLHFADIYTGTHSTGARVFDVSIEGVQVLNNLDIYSEVGGYAALIKTFNITVTDNSLNILFTHEIENPKISGIEIHQLLISTPTPTPTPPSHFAHSVAGDDQTIVDFDDSGSESVSLDGSFSHTHAFGENLVTFEWMLNGEVIASSQVSQVLLPVGIHNIDLNIEDSAGNTANDSLVVIIYEPDKVPGLIGYFYDYSDLSDLTVMPNMDLRKPTFGKLENQLNYSATTSNFPGTPYSNLFAARFKGLINIENSGQYTFGIESNDGSKLYIDGQLLINNDGLHVMQKKTGSKSLSTGLHQIMVEYFEQQNNSGVILTWTPPGQSEAVVPASFLTHDYRTLIPIIHEIDPINGPLGGGNTININGFGFVFDSNQTVINLGNSQIQNPNIISSSEIEFTAPAGQEGTTSLSVETPNSISNSKNYIYGDSLPPVQFSYNTLLAGIGGPTSLAFGPDGKLYVGTQFGEVWIITLDAQYNVLNTVVSDIVSTSEPDFRTILGVAFNPLDDPTNPKLYVSHSNLFHGQIKSFNGKISVLSGPGLTVKEDLITGLPISDHDHGVNGLEFDNEGDLYIQVGGITNAGVPGELSGSGSSDEQYFSAGTLIAHISDEDFDGNIVYDVNGYPVSTASVDVFASGLRNPFDLVLHSNGKLYSTDNGPNFGFGDKSVTCTTSGSDPDESDELNILIDGSYYGHANRKRGVLDVRQCTWRSKFQPSDSQYTAPIASFPASTNGITEYWTDNFEGQMRGHLLLSRWIGELFEVTLSPDGNSVIDQNTFSSNGGLDVTVAPDGSIFLARHNNNELAYFKPIETGTDFQVLSVFYNRGPVSGGREVKITVRNIDPGLSTQISFGGQNCPVTDIGSGFVKCTVPANLTPGQVDVTVINGGNSDTLINGYTYMNSLEPVENSWFYNTPLPISLGEVSAASLNGYLYIFAGETSGGNNQNVYRFDKNQNTWQQMASQTVIPAGDHMAAQVINGKIYAFGGCVSGGESNSLAVYDPLTNSWQQKAGLIKSGQPYGICSPSSAAINGKLYIAGGIHSGSTITNTFVYDPVSDSWQEIASMPQGRNHAAGVGYNGKFYIFGGRCCGGNVPGSGNPQSYVYNPANNSWGQVANLPTPRGGMGSAVVLNGEILVIGGEGSGPFNGTFNDVEAYNPQTNVWRDLPSLQTARHGTFPVEVYGDIHVVAGGTSEGFSTSNIHEVYSSSEPLPSPQEIIRINAGGPAFVDPDGKNWSADTFYNTGNTYSTGNSISGTLNDQLYQSERWDPASGAELEYNVPVQNGDYQIILHFADIYSGTHSVGARVFDVSIEDALVLDDFDIYALVGGFAATSQTFNTSVTDGIITVLLTHEIENPKISGIEIIEL